MLKVEKAMEKIIVLYHFQDSDIGRKIDTIATTLGIKIRHIQEDELRYPIGYFIGLEGYDKPIENSKSRQKIIPEEAMLIMHYFDDQEINQFLKLCNEHQVPFIALKAIVTPNNVNWGFVKLHQHIKEEYQKMEELNK